MVGSYLQKLDLLAHSTIGLVRGVLSIPCLLYILRACPDLTYLGLDAVIGMGDSFQTQRGVTLPRLERLSVVDTDTYRISSFLEQLSTPNSVECDFISVDWALLNRRTLPVSSPLGRFTLTEAVTMVSPSHYPFKWMIECSWETRGAIRCHFDSSVNDQPMDITIDDQQSMLINSLKDSIVPFERVKTLTIRRMSTSGNAQQILELFPSVETLRAGCLTLNPSPGQTNAESIKDMLWTDYRAQLQNIEIVLCPVSHVCTASLPSAKIIGRVHGMNTHRPTSVNRMPYGFAMALLGCC